MGTTKIPSCSVSSTLQKGTITLFHRGSTPLVLNCIKYCRTGMLQMFRTTSFRMITESPGFIRAAPRWFSVSRYNKALAPYGLLSEMTGQPTVLFNAFSSTWDILLQKNLPCQAVNSADVKSALHIPSARSCFPIST